MIEASSAKYFQDHKYEREIRFLLRTNAKKFTKTDTIFLDAIFEQGPWVRPGDDNQDRLYWYLRMFEALKENSHYAGRFEELSKKLNVSVSDFQDSNRAIAVPVNFESPLSSAQLMRTPHDDIVRTIRDFKPEPVWRGPSTEGFARELGKAVEQEPEYFSIDLEKYNEIPYIYAYFLLDGFREAWKNKKHFDWGQVLSFCQAYINSNAFLERSAVLWRDDDGWGADHKLVIGAIGNLITEGTQSDENAFDPMYLPLAKDVIMFIVPKLSATDEYNESLDYTMNAFNSTAGKPIRALLDISLRKARLSKSETNRWDSDMKSLFTETISKKIIDSYVFEGIYYQQLFYLDQDWITNQFKVNYSLEEKYWLGFIEGFFFANPPYNEDVYRLSIPHYERAISLRKFGSEHYRGHGIARHLGVMYLRGYDNLSNSNVITLFLNRSNTSGVDGIISFIRQQEDYIKELALDERRKFQTLVLELWKYILTLYSDTEIDEEQKILSNLNNLIGFIEKLDDENSDLLVRTVGYVDRTYNTHHVINVLNLLKEKGEPAINALHIGKILNAFSLNDYLKTFENSLLHLIQFVYEHGQKELANKLCNKLGLKGYEFQKALFAKYNQ
jgi:hypothetical protein